MSCFRLIRARGQPPRHLFANERLERGTVQPLRRLLGGSREGRESGEIAPVALEGVIGEPPFYAQMVEVRVDHRRMIISAVCP